MTPSLSRLLPAVSRRSGMWRGVAVVVVLAALGAALDGVPSSLLLLLVPGVGLVVGGVTVLVTGSRRFAVAGVVTGMGVVTLAAGFLAVWLLEPDPGRPAARWDSTDHANVAYAIGAAIVALGCGAIAIRSRRASVLLLGASMVLSGAAYFAQAIGFLSFHYSR